MSHTFAATVAVAGFNLIAGVLLARALGPEGRGIVAAAILWPTLLRFLVMVGLTESVTFAAARPATRLDRLVGTTIGMGAVQGAALLALGAAVLPLTLSGDSRSGLTAGFVVLGTMTVGTVGLYMLSILNGAGRYGMYNLLRSAVMGIRVIVLGAFALLWELTVITAVLAYTAGVLPTTLAAAAVARRMAGGIGRPDKVVAERLIQFGWRAQLSSTRNPLSEQLDQYVISIFLAPVELGLYAVAFTTTLVIGFLSATLAVIALPRIAAAQAPDRQGFLAQRFLGWAFISSVAAAAPIFAFTPQLIDLVFGEAFDASVDATRILLVAAVATGVTRVGSSILNGLNRPGDAGIAGAVSLGGSAAAMVPFLPLFGIEGAAAAILLGYALSTGWILARISRATAISWLRLLVPPRRTYS